MAASDAEAGDRFGVSVSLENDRALIGAYWNDDDGPNSGSVYIFERSGTLWTERHKLTVLDASAGDYFGHRVRLSGNTVVGGASRADSAYVFELFDTLLRTTTTAVPPLTPPLREGRDLPRIQ